MGPKSQKGKKKPAKDVPEVNPEDVTELEKEFFTFQLSDIEKKIERLHNREEELKAGTLEIKEKIEELRKEKGAIIDEHEQLLNLKEEEKMRRREEMLELGDEIKNRIVRHKKHIEELKEKFEKMVSVLSEKIKEQEEEIRIQEDFKQNREMYEAQLDEMERQMAEAELQHKRNLFEIEKKFEVAKKRVKKDLQCRLIHLSIEFQETTKKKIGNPCHRATQENKAIQNALLQLQEDIIEYQDRCVISKKNVTAFKNQTEANMLEKDKMIARTVIQVSVIKTLKEDYAKLLKKLKAYDVVELENKNLLKKFQEISMELESKNFQIQKMEEKIRLKIERTNELTEAVKYLTRSFRKLRVLLSNAKKLAEEAMAVRLIPVGMMEEERWLPTDSKIRQFKLRREAVFAKKGRMLRYLLEFLSKGQMTEEDKQYLKLVPEDLDFEIEVDFKEVFGRPEYEEMEIKREISEEDLEKGPMFFTSLTSMARSLTVAVKVKKHERVPEEYEGEGEEERGEHDEVMGRTYEYPGEDFEIEEEEEENEDKKTEGGMN